MALLRQFAFHGAGEKGAEVAFVLFHGAVIAVFPARDLRFFLLFKDFFVFRIFVNGGKGVFSRFLPVLFCGAVRALFFG